MNENALRFFLVDAFSVFCFEFLVVRLSLWRAFLIVFLKLFI